ncbi:MAG: hypothetical protein LBU89_00485 [Fibromonadaceae bacterium]|jgi:hypothetical protein|nr:hypothetical protein [Fibromonadaceae bacterium]
MLPIRLLFLLFIFSLCSCGSNIVALEDGTKGSISVIIVNAATGLSVENASARLLGIDSAPKKADSTGGVAYENLPAGNGYTFLVEAPGYASMLCKTDLYLDGIAGHIVLEARLPKLGAKLQGNIAYADLSTGSVNNQPVGSGEAKVRLNLSVSNECELVNPYRETSTGLNGLYFFDSLPELANYDLIALESKIGNINYEQFFLQNDGLLGFSGDIIKAPLGTYENAVSLEDFRLLSAPGTIFENEKIALVFSKGINKSRTSIMAFSAIGTSHAVEIEWNDDRTLEISPVDGLWKAGSSISVVSTASLYATDGTIIYPGTLATIEVIGKALKAPAFWLENAGTGTALNAKRDSLDLSILSSQQQGLVFRWNRVENADGYNIYAKCSGEINYTQVWSLFFTPDTSFTWSNYSAYSNCFAENKQSSFFVRAINSREYVNSKIVSIWGHKPK